LTTSTIGGYNPLPRYGYNYNIKAQRKGTSNSIICKLIANNDLSWSSMQLSYLTSSRPEITIGNFDAPVSTWRSGISKVYNVEKKLSKKIPKTHYQVAAFISGFSTAEDKLSLTIGKKKYDQNQNSLGISFYCSSKPKTVSVTITYIIYPLNHPQFDISYNLRSSSDLSAYQVSGPVAFQRNKAVQYNEWRVGRRQLGCLGGGQCQNGCVLKEECRKKSGNLWKDQCVFCSTGIVFDKGQCTNTCGPNQVYLNKVCVCASGFVKQGTQCVNVNKRTCGANQIFSQSANRCVCASDSYDINGNT